MPALPPARSSSAQRPQVSIVSTSGQDGVMNTDASTTPDVLPVDPNPIANTAY